MQRNTLKDYSLEATPVARAKEIKDERAPKAKRIVVGADVHLRGYQAARKVDNAAIGAVANFRSETELLLYLEKQCEQTEEVVVVYEAGPLGYGLYRKLTARGVKCVPRHAIPWERGGFSDKLFRRDWHVGHGVMCQRGVGFERLRE